MTKKIIIDMEWSFPLMICMFFLVMNSCSISSNLGRIATNTARCK